MRLGYFSTAFDFSEKQSGRRRSDLPPRRRAEALRFGTSLRSEGTLAETDIPGPRAADEVPLSREDSLFVEMGPILEWP